MTAGMLFILVSGFWGLAMIVNLVETVRLCYAVEHRSGRENPKLGLPVFANIWGVAMNQGVAQDEETQDLRRQMNRRLMIIVGGFVVFALFVLLAGPSVDAA
jgi:hypothetical protein